MHDSPFSPDSGTFPADDLTLAEYLEGTSDPADRERIDAWSQQAPGHAERLEQLSAIWQAAVRPVPEGNAEVFVPAVLAKIASSAPAPVQRSAQQPAFVTRRPGRRWWAYGTVAATLLAVIAVGRQNGRWNSPGQSPAAALEYATAAGQQSIIALPDGSSVTLAPQTRLHYTVLEHGEREVRLSGQALFEVRPNGTHPFVVRAGNVVTRVLGTAFTVEHYPEDSTVSVAVLSGKVATGGRGIPVTLTAGMVATVRDSSASVATAPDINSYINWTNGRLVFNDVPVPQLLATMSRWYGYQFQLRDSALSARYATATFNVDAPEETMLALSRLLGVTLDVRDSVIVLHPRSPNPRHKPAPTQRANPQHSLLPDLELGR